MHDLPQIPEYCLPTKSARVSSRSQQDVVMLFCPSFTQSERFLHTDQLTTRLQVGVMANIIRMLSGNVVVNVFKSDAVIWWAAILRRHTPQPFLKITSILPPLRTAMMRILRQLKIRSSDKYHPVPEDYLLQRHGETWEQFDEQPKYDKYMKKFQYDRKCFLTILETSFIESGITEGIKGYDALHHQQEQFDSSVQEHQRVANKQVELAPAMLRVMQQRR